jgi:hypothetical protein
MFISTYNPSAIHTLYLVSKRIILSCCIKLEHFIIKLRKKTLHYISNHRKLLLRYVFDIEWYFWLLKTETNILRKKTDLESWQIASGVQHILCCVLFCFPSSCVTCVSSFSRFLILDCLSVFSNHRNNLLTSFAYVGKVLKQ